LPPEGTAVEGLFTRRAFKEFGPNGLFPSADIAIHRVAGSRPAQLRTKVRAECPRRPGVYGMVNTVGDLIYVGKAKNLRARLLSYFRPRSRDPKAGRVIHEARELVWEPASSEFAALLRELELIRRWQPRLNVQGQPTRRRRCYVCIGRGPAPTIQLRTQPSSRATACYGPVLASRRAREAVRHLDDLFRLRDCPQSQEMVFADQRELFPVVHAAGCIRHEIGTCIGPCAAACSVREYAEQVRLARSFLEGRDRRALSKFEREMADASQRLQFERAAALRDKLDVLRWLADRLDFMRRARAKHSFVYPVAGHDGATLWFLVRQGQVHAAIPAPLDASSKEAAATRVESVYGKGRASRQSPSEEIDGILLVVSWFRRHPEERQRTIPPGLAIAACER
jgi:excinuclease ABC subunit C